VDITEFLFQGQTLVAIADFDPTCGFSNETVRRASAFFVLRATTPKSAILATFPAKSASFVARL
jgi:hypothetical protein